MAELPPLGGEAVDCAEKRGTINSFSHFLTGGRRKKAAIFVTRVFCCDAWSFWYQRDTRD